MPAMENKAQRAPGSDARPSSRTLRGVARTASPMSGHMRVEPTGSHGAVSWRLIASVSPGMGGAFAEGMVPGGCLGSLGSGSTLDIDWLEATNYDRNPVSLSAVRAAPDTRSGAGSENGSEGFGPAVEGHEEKSLESVGCGGGDGGNGGGTVGESGLEATVRHQGKTLERLEAKIDDGLKEQRKANMALLKKIEDGDSALRQKIEDGQKEQREANAALLQKIEDGDSALRQKIEDGQKEQREANAALLQKIEDGDSALLQKIEDGDSALRQKIEDGQKEQREANAALLQKIEDGDSALRQKIEDGDSALRQSIDSGQKEQREANAALLQKIEDGDSALRQKIEDGDSALRQSIDSGQKEQRESQDKNFRWFLGGAGALVLVVFAGMLGAMTDLFRGR